MILKTLQAMMSSKNYVQQMFDAGISSFDDLDESEKDILVGLLILEADVKDRDEFLTESKNNQRFTQLYVNNLLAAQADKEIKEKLEQRLTDLMREMSHDYYRHQANELFAADLEKHIIEENNLPANYFIPNLRSHSRHV